MFKRKNDAPPVVRIEGYVPDLTKKPPVPDEDMVHLCKMRIRAVPNEDLDRKNSSLRSLILPGAIRHNICGVEGEEWVKRNECKAQTKKVLGWKIHPITVEREKLAEELLENIVRVERANEGRESGIVVICKNPKRARELAEILDLHGISICEEEELKRIMRDAEFFREKFGELPPVVSPKKFFNGGKRRWKQ